MNEPYESLVDQRVYLALSPIDFHLLVSLLDTIIIEQGKSSYLGVRAYMIRKWIGEESDPSPKPETPNAAGIDLEAFMKD